MQLAGDKQIWLSACSKEVVRINISAYKLMVCSIWMRMVEFWAPNQNKKPEELWRSDSLSPNLTTQSQNPTWPPFRNPCEKWCV